MATNTIVGCFDDPAEARQAERELAQAGIPQDQIHLVAQGAGLTGQSANADEPGFWRSIKEAFGFADESDRTSYTEYARRGGTLLSVDAPENATDRAVEILRRHHVVDLDQRASQWRQQGWAGYQSGAQQTRSTAAPTQQQQRSSAAAAGKEVIPVVQEELQVGKRQVQTGGVRVYSRVTEKPVEEKVQLREERVKVERRPVDRPVTNADAAFKERTIEARETAEQPVVQKQARVVEEIAVNKDVKQREQTVRDTVRRTDVDVQQMQPGQAAAFSSDAFVNEIKADARYRGRTWDGDGERPPQRFPEAAPQRALGPVPRLDPPGLRARPAVSGRASPASVYRWGRNIFRNNRTAGCVPAVLSLYRGDAGSRGPLRYSVRRSGRFAADRTPATAGHVVRSGGCTRARRGTNLVVHP
jgi:uncharacterized protein (TIGR02271 family)